MSVMYGEKRVADDDDDDDDDNIIILDAVSTTSPIFVARAQLVARLSRCYSDKE